MTRSQLVARLAKRRESLSNADVEVVVKSMIEHLAGGGRIEIRGFGSFSLRPRRAQLARNPRTGELLGALADPASALVYTSDSALHARVRA